MKSTDDVVKALQEALAHHESEVRRIRAMLVAAGQPAPGPAPQIVPMPYPVPPTWQPVPTWPGIMWGDPIVTIGGDGRLPSDGVRFTWTGTGAVVPPMTGAYLHYGVQ